jgi:hypothetical protein
MFNKGFSKNAFKMNANFYFFLVLFCYTFISNNSFAQKDPTNNNLTISSTEIDPQSAPQQSANAANYKENRIGVSEFWKKYLAEEASIKTYNVNVDSIYIHYAQNRKYSSQLPDFFMIKIIPHQSLFTLNKFAIKDSMLFNKILPTNKYFSTLIINNEKDYNAFLNYAPEWDVFVPKTIFTTSEIINSILPPYIISDKSKNTANAYGKFINYYFTSNPELVYFCSNAYLNMLAKQQFEKMMLLHTSTSNTLNLTTSSKEKK